MMEKMKRVLELGEFVSVPQSFIRCSVCLCWNEKDSYCSDLNGVIHETLQRTNCRDCYETPQKEWDRIKKDAELRDKNISEEAQLEIAMTVIQNNCVNVKDMINELQKLPENAMIMINGIGDEIFANIELRKKNTKEMGKYSKILNIIDNELKLYEIG